MGAPFSGSWDAVTDAAYYAGAGFEAGWLWISIAMCVIALAVAHRHESKANSQ